MIYHHGRTYAKLLHLHLEYEPGYVVQYYKTGEFIMNHPADGGNHRTNRWHQAHVMPICDAEHYENIISKAALRFE